MTDAPDLEQLARQTMDLWQEFLTQASTDPEYAEALKALMPSADPAQLGDMSTWPFFPAAAFQRSEAGDDGASGQKRTETVPDAPDGGDDRVDELVRRIADLEKRLADLEPGAPKKGRSARKPAEKRSS